MTVNEAYVNQLTEITAVSCQYILQELSYCWDDRAVLHNKHSLPSGVRTPV